MKPLWLVVANHTQARIFTAESPTLAELTEIEDLTHPQSRLHDREMTSDLPGKIKSPTVGGHAFEAATDPKQHEAVNFAHRLAQRLESGLNANAFDRLAIIAEPTFLGMLRHCLSAPVKNTICFQRDSNLANFSIEVIRSHLPARLPC